jgi:hypothetical protein
MRRHKFLVFLAGAALLYAWAEVRIPRLADYQMPPRPIMHGNYYTYHDMSEQWNLGKRPGVLDMTKNGQYNALGNPYADYSKFQPAQQQHYYCDYYDLDIGFLFPTDLARRLFDIFPDNYLRTLALQVWVDLLATGGVFAALIGWGWLPALAGGLFYATNISIATQMSLAFYYFWDAMVALAALLLMTSLYANARKPRMTPSAVLLALTLGTLLGFGVWLRSSWAAYSFVLLGLMCFSRTLWRYIPVAVLAFIVCSSYPIVRASKLLGHFAITTRQSWSAAFEALGKDPNIYGLENDDQYLFDVAREKYGAVDDNCQGTKRDAALKQEYLDIWRKDPDFIIHSIANRMYLGFLKNGARQQDDADRNALWLAIIGCGWLTLRGGARRWLAIPAAALFVVSTASVCLVYFVTPHYNGVSQVCLVLLGAGTFDLVAYFLPRGWSFRRWWRHVRAAARLTRLRKWPVLAATTALVLVSIVLSQQSVRAYFAAPLYLVEWFPPADLSPDKAEERAAQIRRLPDDQRRQLLMALGVEAGAADPAAAAAARLKHLVGQNIRDNVTRFDLELESTFAPAAQQALWHAERFVLGFTVDQITGFELSDSSTWSGQVLRFRLKPIDQALLDTIVPVFLQKFEQRGLKLQSRSGNTFVFTKLTQSDAPLARKLHAGGKVCGRIVRREESLEHVEAGFGDGSIAPRSLADVMGVLLRVGVGVGGRDRVSDEPEDIVVEYPVAHENHVGRIVLRSNPGFAVNGADEIERKRHVVDDSLLADRESLAIARDEADIEVRLHERETVMVVRPEHLHELSFGRVVERSRRHDAVDVENEGLW